MSLEEFIKTYYINPVVLNEGYNFVNTLTYAILAVVVVYLTYRYLEKSKVKVDKNFVMGILPLVIFGTFIRLFEEAGIYQSYFLVTPMIWIEAFAAVVVLFLISRIIEKKFDIPYYKTLFVIGVLSCLAPLYILLTRLMQVNGMLISLALLIPISLVLYFVKWNTGNKLVLLSHAFDATATFTAVQFFGFRELHVVPRLLIEYFSPVSFIFVKLIVVVAVLIIIDKNSDDKNFNNFLKFSIAIIGLAPAIRDFFLLGL